jgi:2-amino-4-hydroxy-6-hydroxymethyldihydropteridine diphosphokinase
VILVGLGSNIAFGKYASPRDTAIAALRALPSIGVAVTAAASWYESEPVPASDQPWFANSVVAVETLLEPDALLAALLALETRFGRVRGERNAARTLDLDLLSYHEALCNTETLILPHPRLHERRFVLAPLCEIAPDWRHPRLGVTAAALLTRLPSGQSVRRQPAASSRSFLLGSPD